MINLSNTSELLESQDDLRYYIAQHVSDILRMESRNVGVLVTGKNELAARFLGEPRHVDSEVDGRALRGLENPDLYKMWIRHWRKTFKEEGWEQILAESNSTSFSILPRGVVTGTSAESIDDVCDYLYSTLVSDGGLSEAIEDEEEESQENTLSIKRKLHSDMRDLGLMRSNLRKGFRHPVAEDSYIKGTVRFPHRITFCQNGKSDLVFEPLNLGTSKKKPAIERAGYISNMFQDLHEANSTIKTAAVVQMGSDRTTQHVKYALGLLENNTEVIDWAAKSNRTKFLSLLEERAAAA